MKDDVTIAGYAPRRKTGEYAEIKPHPNHTFTVAATDRPDVWSAREQMLFGMVMQMHGSDPEVTWGPVYENKLLNGPTYILKSETGGVYNPTTGWTPKEIAADCVLSPWEVRDLKETLGDDLQGLQVHTYSKLEAVAPLYAAVEGGDEDDEFEPADCVEHADTFSVDVLIRFPSAGENDVLIQQYEERDMEHSEVRDVVGAISETFPAAEIDEDLLGAFDTLEASGPKF